MTFTPTLSSRLIDINRTRRCKHVNSVKSQLQRQELISLHQSRFRQNSRRQRMDCTTNLLGKAPHNPRHIPTSHPPSQSMIDVVAVLSDSFFFASDAQHELGKRRLNASGCQDELLRRLYKALEAEHADGWTLGYLLNTRTVPFNGKGRAPQSLVGHHVEGYKCDGNGIILGLSDGEDVTVLSSESSDECATIKMDHDLFWALHTLDAMKAVPRNLVRNPLLITEAVTGVRKNRWGKEAGAVFGLKLEGMRAISFFFLAGEACTREDRMCGNVWLAENDLLRGDIRMLHGGDETIFEEMRERHMTQDETLLLGEDMRGLHGYGDDAWD